jgi:Mg-chelatase subunit ChlD
MKIHIISSLSLISFLFLATPTNLAQTEGARHFVIGLSVGCEKEKANDLLKRCFQLLLNQSKAGDRVQILGAPSLVTLADVVVPPGSARERANSRVFAGKFGALQTFVSSASADPRSAGQLRLPQLLDEVARRRQVGKPVTVILVGSPVFMTTNAVEHAFNMDDGLVPGDGMITASAGVSLFGTKERVGQLEKVTIHWFVPDEQWGLGEIQRGMVLRFWTAFIQSQSGVLATFGSDSGNIFDRAISGETRPVMTVTLNPDDRELVMRSAPAFRREVRSVGPPVSVQESEPRSVVGASEAGKPGLIKGGLATATVTVAREIPEAIPTNSVATLLDKPAMMKAGGESKPSQAVLNTQPKEEAASERATLPVGARATVMDIATNDMPKQFSIDLQVEDVAGRVIDTLTAKDFQVSVAGRSPGEVQISQFKMAPPMMNVLLALDRSSSMAGAAFYAAVKSAQELILGLRSGSKEALVKVMAFSDSIEIVADWTQNMRAAALALDNQRARGATALYEAIETGWTDLQSREGNRRLVVFTDGRNTKSWNGDIANLMSRFKTSNIPIVTIGLRTRELDAATLQRLAESTGGRYVEAASVRDIAPSFRMGGRELQQTLYRIVVTPLEGVSLNDGPLQIAVGGTNGVVVNHNPVTTAKNKEK